MTTVNGTSLASESNTRCLTNCGNQGLTFSSTRCWRPNTKNMKYKKVNKYKKKTGVGGPRLHLGFHLLRRLAGRPLGLAGGEVVKVFSFDKIRLSFSLLSVKEIFQHTQDFDACWRNSHVLLGLPVHGTLHPVLASRHPQASHQHHLPHRHHFHRSI